MDWLKFTNFGETTLSSELASGAVTASVANGSVFPSTGNFMLVINSSTASLREIVKCTGRDGNTLTITRAQEGTTQPSAHASTSPVALVFTKGTIEELQTGIDSMGGASITIAAADTPTLIKDRADVVCDGTNSTGGDQSEINTAFGSYDTVRLCEGTYWIDAKITIGSGQRLIGVGQNSVIKIMDTCSAMSVVENYDVTGGNYDIVISDLCFDGNVGNQTQYVYHKMIDLTKVAVSDVYNGARILNCTFKDVSYACVNFNSCTGFMLSQCSFSNIFSGISVDSSSIACTISSCIFLNCYDLDSYPYWINIAGTQCTVVGNVFHGDSYIGVNISSNASLCTVSNNVFEVKGDSNIEECINVQGDRCTFTGNVFKGYTPSNGVKYGIFLYTGSNNCVVNGNVFYQLRRAALNMFSTTGSIISNNIFYENGIQTGNTYYHIEQSNASAVYNLIKGNIFRQGESANKAKGAIKIYSGATGNIIEGNDFYNCGATEDISDSGTGTKKRNNISITGGWLAEDGCVFTGAVGFNTEAYYDAVYDNGNSGSSKNIDWTLGNKQKITFTADCTATFTDPSGPANLVLFIYQDAVTGGWSPTWPNTVIWPDSTAVPLNTGAGTKHLMTLDYDGTNYWVMANTSFGVPS